MQWSGYLTPACSAGKELSQKVVKAAFEYAQETETPLCAFLGDKCVTLRMTDELLVCPCNSVTQLSQQVQPVMAVLTTITACILPVLYCCSLSHKLPSP